MVEMQAAAASGQLLFLPACAQLQCQRCFGTTHMMLTAAAASCQLDNRQYAIKPFMLLTTHQLGPNTHCSAVSKAQSTP
jgi:hypothetical protein